MTVFTSIGKSFTHSNRRSYANPFGFCVAQSCDSTAGRRKTCAERAPVVGDGVALARCPAESWLDSLRHSQAGATYSTIPTSEGWQLLDISWYCSASDPPK